jgi:RNA polymerase sigma-70 factor (ECF subfamily)
MVNPESTTNPLEHQTDEELIVGFQKGNAPAFDLLVARYKDPLTNYVFRFLGDWGECSVVVQETFVRVYQKRDSYKPIAKFSTWIYTIATNVAKSRFRKKGFMQLFSFMNWRDQGNGAYDIPDESSRADLRLESSMEEERIQKALDTLPIKYRQVVLLRDVQELSYDEIVGITGLTLGTVKSRINRARLKLQELLKDE